jgi:RHS repeat-associated protein
MKTKIVVALLILVGIAQACPTKPVSLGKVYSGVLKPGCTITFSGADSYDLSGRCGGVISQWSWMFDYQGVWEHQQTFDSPYVEHTYTATGTYTVAIRCKSAIGSMGNLYTFQVVISDLKSYYYVKDHLGSVRVTVNDSGTVVAYNDYDPWGMQLDGRNSTSAANEKLKFTSKERDVETGYDYFGARYYDSRIARWLQVDPLERVKNNLSTYQYVNNNPIFYRDPDGQKEKPFNALFDKPITRISGTATYFKDGPSKAYNCHSFAWHNSMGDMSDSRNRNVIAMGAWRWDNFPDDDIREYSAIQLSSNTPNIVGDKVVYYVDLNGNGQWDEGEPIYHSAVVEEVDNEGNTTVVGAKMGQSELALNHPGADNYYNEVLDKDDPNYTMKILRTYFRVPVVVNGERTGTVTNGPVTCNGNELENQ